MSCNFHATTTDDISTNDTVKSLETTVSKDAHFIVKCAYYFTLCSITSGMPGRGPLCLGMLRLRLIHTADFT